MSSILLVDDHPAVRSGVGDVLRDAGYEVAEAANASQALKLLEAKAFDLLLVDYLLPEMKGDAIARVARARWPALRIAFLSGYTDFLSLTGKAGDSQLISKPVSAQQLCDGVAAALGSLAVLAPAA
jgi:CheY-like chemotaxis protein